jgi:hypothetical protein
MNRLREPAMTRRLAGACSRRSNVMRPVCTRKGTGLLVPRLAIAACGIHVDQDCPIGP